MPKAARSLGIVFFPAFDWAISPTHPEREERLLYTHDQLIEDGLFDIDGITEYKPELATYADIEAAHFCFPSTRAVSTDSHLASAGGAMKAGRLVMEKKCERSFALVRPPGHHAMRITHGNRGFCNVNIEAVMLAHLRKLSGPLRVAIVDTDCHHGDGTQDIYWNDPDTLFISLHQDGRTLYPGSGGADEYGGPGALGKTLNIPLPPGTNDEGYLYVIDNCVLPALKSFKPDLIINSAGQDNHYTDPITSMSLSAQGYAELNKRLNPHIAVLEGGYSVRGALPYVNLGICLALAGMDFSHIREPDFDPRQNLTDSRRMDAIKYACDDALKIWNNPPTIPSAGSPRKDRFGAWWVTQRSVYYDTDGISSRDQQAIMLCGNCPGLSRLETASSHTDYALCLLLPRNACPQCAQTCEELRQDADRNGRISRVIKED
jgi:acetoin utilization deacetylase AcuC-like enzyme